MDFGGGRGGEGVAPVTFLGKKSWKISISSMFKYFEIIYTKYTKSSIFVSVFNFKYIFCAHYKVWPCPNSEITVLSYVGYRLS